MKKCMIMCCLMVSFFVFSQDKTVTVRKIKASKAYETLFYGARLQPAALISYSSPVTGVVSKVYVKEGDMVRPGTNLISVVRRSSSTDFLPSVVISQVTGVVGKINVVANQEVTERLELIVIADISSYKTDLLLSDKDIVRIKKGDFAYIIGTSLFGNITSVAIIPEGNTGLFRASVEFKPDRKLFSGAFVQLEIRVDYFEGVLVPVEWVANKYGKTIVTIAVDNKVVFREVKVGTRYGKRLSIQSGLKPGDRVIVKYNKAIFDGDEVTVTEEAENTKQS